MAAGAPAAERLEHLWSEPGRLISFLTTVDHKRIGVRYLVTSGAFFVLGGLEALTMRTQLAGARQELVDPDVYNQLFTMHGLTMIFLFVTPILSGFGNYLVPLMIGARDMAFPRANAFSYWTYLFSGLFLYSSLAFGLAPNDGWFNYVPLASIEYTPDKHIDYYNLFLLFLAISTTAGAINFIVTIFKLRAPGMSVNRMPLFVWSILVTSFALVFALPALSAANLMLELQRHFGWHFFDVEAGGDPLLWQHLFWIFGHPDVYIMLLPAVGIVSTVIPVFARRPVVGYRWLVLSTVAIGIIGFGVWVHHMFAVGLPQISLAFFAAASMAITIPSGIQVFAWLSTLLTGRPVLTTPLLFVTGFLVVFVVGGVTGVMFAAIPFDQQVTDSYFVVAHFHYVLMGGAVFPIMAGIHYWLPKISGRMYSERLGRISFWTFFVGFNAAFFPMHVTGLLGMPRRVYTYADGLGWEAMNLTSTIGAYVLALGVALILVNLVRTLVAGPRAGRDPFGADTLEWSVSSPPPHYNFTTIPRVESRHPVWDQERAGGDLTLTDGHQTPSTSVLDGDLERDLHMPEPSPVPLLAALALGVLFVGLLAQLYLMAIAGAVLVLAVVATWHRPRPGMEAQ